VPHAPEEAILSDILVKQSGRGMPERHDEDRVRREPVPLRQRPAQCPVSDLRQRYRLEQGVAPHEGVCDAEAHHDEQKRVKQEMRAPRRDLRNMPASGEGSARPGPRRQMILTAGPPPARSPA